MELRDRVVVVTGGASGIGAALCRRAAAEGARAVVVADLDGDGAAAVAEEIGGTPVVADVASEGGVVALVEETEAAHGPIDLYCSNAGIAVGGGPEASTEGWHRSWDVNVMAHVYAARRLVPGWVERGEGALLGTVSAAGLLNHVLAAPYAATKAAALSFLEWLAIAHGDDGVLVSALCPQGVRTPMLAQDPSSFLQADALAPEVVADVVVAGLRDERFLILPHPEVAEYAARRGGDHDRWVAGMRRLRRRILAAAEEHA